MKKKNHEQCSVCVKGHTDADGIALSNKIHRRLLITKGQIEGVVNMVQRGEYCVDIITQTAAIKQALSNIEDLLLEQHLSTCVVQQVKEGQGEKAVDEILKVYKLKRK